MTHRTLSVVLFACLAAPAVAFAGNGIEPRTPVEWPMDTACLAVVDRTQDVMLHLPYGVPFEDTDVTADEVVDSRTHQFLAFCRDHSREEFLPTWLTWKDVDAAAAKDLIDPMMLQDEDVLETSTVWGDCWFRITPDDARRPITFAEAAKGVDWDTTMLPAGAYVVQGYTWEPWVNIYSQRPGVIHVVDGPALEPVGPAAAVSTTLDYAFAEDTFLIEGCARTLPGSTLSGYWSLTSGEALEWLPFAEGVALDGETFELPFMPPPEASGQTVALRVDVTDPMQRTFSAYPINLLTILPGSGEGTTTGCNPEASFIGDPCDTGATAEPATTSTTTGAGTSGITGGGPGGGESSGDAGSSSSTTGPALVPEPNGCACEATAPSAPGWAGALLLVVGRRRRRH